MLGSRSLQAWPSCLAAYVFASALTHAVHLSRVYLQPPCSARLANSSCLLSIANIYRCLEVLKAKARKMLMIPSMVFTHAAVCFGKLTYCRKSRVSGAFMMLCDDGCLYVHA